jgi:hypothetical protein
MPDRTHRIEVFVTSYGGRGAIYRVMHAGQVLVAGCRCPLLEACRALLARGITGRLEIWRHGKPTWDVAADIEAGSKLTVIESENRGPCFGPWTPAPSDALSRVRHRARTATDGSPVPLPTQEREPVLEPVPAK